MSGIVSFLESALHGDTTIVLLLITLSILLLSTWYLTRSSSHTKQVALNPEEFQPFTLIQKDSLSHDTRRFTFALQTPQTKLGLPIGQHISFRFIDKEGKTHQRYCLYQQSTLLPYGVSLFLFTNFFLTFLLILQNYHKRSYTPVTGDEVVGTVTFVIKVYKAGIHPKFPEGGKMSQYLDSLQIGDTIDMKGPKGHLHYVGKGQFTVKELGKPLEKRWGMHFGMIAGGTGITPCVQVIEAMVRDEKDTCTISLLYANQSTLFQNFYLL